MKRLLGIIGILMICLSMNAQIDKRNQFAVEAGTGSALSNFVVNLGFRWQMNLHPNIAWDVLTVKATTTPDSDILDAMLAEGMTGVRLTSYEFAGMSVYATGKVGYGHYIDISNGGVCYEFGAGLNITSHLSVGYAFNEMSYKDSGVKCKWKSHSFQIGWTF